LSPVAHPIGAIRGVRWRSRWHDVARAGDRKSDVDACASDRLREARSTGGLLDPGLRVILNFHPDRTLVGVPILVSFAADGVYRSQLETGTSNGGLTAHPWGDRWRWESSIFGRMYDDAAPRDRPKYGALNFRGHSAGAARRFGSAHFRLGPDTLRRTTCPVQWRDGFRLGFDLALHPDYRGPEFVALRLELAQNGFIDARIIGEALRQEGLRPTVAHAGLAPGGAVRPA